MEQEGLIYIFTGNGKGKTTAALGQAVRASGRGWKVLIVQFIKQIPSGEVEPLRRLGIEIYPMGAGFVGTREDKIPFEKHQKVAQQALAFAKDKVKANHYHLLILDEIGTAISLGLLEEEKILQFLQKRPRGLNVILTGRDIPKGLVEEADLVTEMKEIRHPLTKGWSGRCGLEY